MKRLYIIHGWTYTVEPWNKTLSILRKNGLQVKMLNVPGLTVESNKVWDIDKYVKWAENELPDGCVVLGHSNGGRILLNLAKKNPKKIGHLILLNSAGVYKESLRRRVLGLVAKVFAPLKKIKLLRKFFHKVTGVSDYSRAPVNMQKTLSNILMSDREFLMDGILTPTNILWGEEDKITPLEAGEVIHKKLVNSEMKTMREWGHAPYITHAEELAEEILRIMRKLEKEDLK